MDGPNGTFTAYVTKYWETRGILARTVRMSSSSRHMVVDDTDDRGANYYHRGEWFGDEADAVARVRAHAEKRIASLRARADALEKTWLDGAGTP